MKKCVLTVLGTRPQYIKMMSLWPNLNQSSFRNIIVDTGQHYNANLSSNLLEIEHSFPTIQIGDSRQDFQISDVTKKIGKIVEDEKPEALLVLGDTTSTLIGAYVATIYSKKLIHLEAGLRSHDLSMPEERIRRSVDHLSHLHLVPNSSAKENLNKEGIGEHAKVVGNIMESSLSMIFEKLYKIDLQHFKNSKLLCTLHRQSNVDSNDRLKMLLNKLGKISEEIEIIAHPRLQKSIQQWNLQLPSNVSICEPLPYFEFLGKVARSKGVITDSGGLQNDANSLGKTVVVVRKSTEWNEKGEQNIFLDENLENVSQIEWVSRIMNKENLDSNVPMRIVQEIDNFLNEEYVVNNIKKYISEK